MSSPFRHGLRWVSTRTKLLVALAAGISLGVAAWAADTGHFTGRVAVELLDDIQFDHKLRLLEEFAFVDPSGKQWQARKAGVIDWVALPAELRSLHGLPPVTDLRKASVIHSYFAHAQSEPWREVHRMYYAANVAEGMSEPEAKILYLAQYAGGWRWETRASSCFGSCHAAAASLAWKPELEVSDLKPLVDWIWQTKPTLDQIDTRADAVIRRPGPHFFAQQPR